jgi:hypothetical protein
MEPQALLGAQAVLRKHQPVLFVEHAQCSVQRVLHSVGAAFGGAFGGALPYRVYNMPEKNLLLLPQWCSELQLKGADGVDLPTLAVATQNP